MEERNEVSGTETDREVQVDHSDAVVILSALYNAMQYEDGELIVGKVLFNGIPVSSVHMQEGDENYLLAVLVTPDVQEYFTSIDNQEVNEDATGQE